MVWLSSAPLLSDVIIDVPDKLDLTHLKGCGLQPGEVELPEDSSNQAPEPGEFNKCYLTVLHSDLAV